VDSTAIRGSSDPILRTAAILDPPHPQNAEQWADFEVVRLRRGRHLASRRRQPVDTEARADYFDSMFYSVAVVGVNTSALIESGIVGRPCTPSWPRMFAGQQEGTLHFQHLKNVNGGLLTVARRLPGTRRTACRSVGVQPDAMDKSRAFVESFVRPYGFRRAGAGAICRSARAQARSRVLRLSPSC
jgi:hypothetical protein